MSTILLPGRSTQSPTAAPKLSKSAVVWHKTKSIAENPASLTLTVTISRPLTTDLRICRSGFNLTLPVFCAVANNDKIDENLKSRWRLESATPELARVLSYQSTDNLSICRSEYCQSILDLLHRRIWEL